MKPNLLATLVLAALILFTQTCLGQPFATLNEYTGSWESANSWASGAQPVPLTTNIEQEIDVNGYITRNGSLSFANIGANSDYITIYDTLVVMGSMTFENNSINLKVASGGLLVVFGNFTSNNKVTLDNGGTVVVTGDLVLNGGQNDYTDNGGALYVDGDISGNGDTADADAIDQPSSNLSSSADEEEQALYSFITGGGDTPLPITLSYFEGSLQQATIELQWQTLSEENFDYFEVQRSSDGANFGVIGTVKGHGFTSEPYNYAFTDTQPVVGFNYYRLRAVDFDGSAEVFHVIMLENLPDFSNVRVYPNPSNGLSFTLDIPQNISSNTALSLTISDLNGKIVLSREINEQSVHTSFNNKLPEGMYIVSLTADHYVHTIPIIVY